MGRRSGSGSLEGIFWVEGGLGFEHGTGDGEEAVGDAAQGAAMAVTALAQFGMAGAAARVVLNGDAGPMVDGGAQPQMTGLAREDDAALAAAPCYRGDAGQNTFGLACRAALKHFAPGHPEKLISMSVRFAAPAYPGDTIRIELFATTEGVRFRARALERRVLVLERGEIQLA